MTCESVCYATFVQFASESQKLCTALFCATHSTQMCCSTEETKQ